MITDRLLYWDCYEMPLFNFIECITKEDLSAVAKVPGLPLPKDFLARAWNSVFYHYLDLNGDASYKKMFSIMKALIKLDNENYLFQEAARLLRLKYSPELVAFIKSFGFANLKFDPTDREAFAKDINKALTYRKAKIMDADRLRKELQEIQDANKKAKKMQAADYLGVLSDLSKFQGYRLDPKRVNVAEFVTILNSYRKSQQTKPGKSGKN